MKNTSFVRSSGLWLILGALLTLGLGTFATGPESRSTSPEFIIWVSLATITRALILIGTIGLARSDAVGNGWLGKIGLGIALLAGALNNPTNAILTVNYTLGANLEGTSEAVYALGLTFAGIAVLMARRWQGWRRVMPLLSGLYIFLVIFPAIAVTQGGPNFNLAVAGWGVPLLLLGLALRAEAVQDAPRVAPAY